MALVTKDVKTIEELKTVIGQGNKAAVLYDVSTGEAYGLDVEVFINMDTSIGGKAEKTVQIQAGAGLVGGGTLEATREINVVSANDGITVNADNIQLNTVDSLASTSATQPLSANQGKALSDGKVDKVAGKSLIADSEIARLAGVTNQTLSGLGGEATANKQNSLDADGSGTKFPTVDAVNAGLLTKQDVIGYVPEDSANKGQANGYASLGADGLVPSTQLPSFVDDVLEYANLAAFPAIGETGKIYVALDTNKTYRWSGSVYIYITSGAVDSVAGKTGVVTLVKADVGLGNVDNTSDANKPVSTAQQTALNLKENVSNKKTTLTNSDTDYPSCSAVRAAIVEAPYVDGGDPWTVYGGTIDMDFGVEV